MADEQYRWLDRETAERLLSGEPPEAADPVSRDQAERLARTLGALSAPPPSADGELPGEAAALAAFRAVREERAAVGAAAGRQAGTHSSDTGPVQPGTPHGDRSGAVGGPRWTRPLRFGLAAALAVGMVGGAAALAGTGVLPVLSGDPEADPAASVTATGTPSARPRLSPPSKEDAPGGATPEGGSGREAGGAVQGGPDARDDEDADAGDPAARSGRGWKQIASACRDLQEGKGLGVGRQRLVEDAAGGPSRVDAYCRDVLSTTDPDPTVGKRADEAHQDNGNGSVNGNGSSSGNGNGSSNGSGSSNGNGNGVGGGRGASKGQSGSGDGGAQGKGGGNGGQSAEAGKNGNNGNNGNNGKGGGR
ncbi:hypothetical protein SUDANB15_04606 [Streptomyces sp. enrichment culture]|uniref:hypothetical protein n=1 Tax=Streptomyces sp. enrichment culture TaxID=1795815 RepID=UPI003F568528